MQASDAAIIALFRHKLAVVPYTMQTQCRPSWRGCYTHSTHRMRLLLISVCEDKRKEESTRTRNGNVLWMRRSFAISWAVVDWCGRGKLDGSINEMASGHIYDVICSQRHRFIRPTKFTANSIQTSGAKWDCVAEGTCARECQPNGSSPFRSSRSSSRKINMSTLMSNYTISVALFSP